MAFKVKATRLGFYGGHLREEGEEFLVETEEHLGSWMEKVGGKLKGKAAAAKAEQESLEDGGSDESVI